MDPNTAYDRARELAAVIIQGNEADQDDPGWEDEASAGDLVQAYKGLAEQAGELAEAFQALDEWLRKGGYQPDAWQGRAKYTG